MYLRPRYFSIVLALAGDSTTSSVRFNVLFFFVVVLCFVVPVFVDFCFVIFVSVSAVFSAAKPSLPFRTPVSVQFVLYNQPLELHLQEQEGQIRHFSIRQAHDDFIYR